jgi:hypothetical protein
VLEGGPLGDMTTQGPALLQLDGQMSLAPGTQVAGEVHLAIAWYPVPMHVPASSPRPRAIVTDALTYEGQFPQKFRFAVSAPPPPEAQGDLSQWSGEGSSSRGFLVAYVDGNRNGRLDTTPRGSPPLDTVLAISAAGHPSSARSRFFIQYLDGSRYGGDPPERGMRVVQLGEQLDEAAPQTGADDVELVLENSSALNWYLCEELVEKPTPDTSPACNRPSAMRVIGQVHGGDTGSAFLSVTDANFPADVRTLSNADVRVNGTSIPFAQELGFNASYFGRELLTPGTSAAVALRAEGFPPLDFQVAMPEKVTLLEPAPDATFARGSTVRLRWNALPDIELYTLQLANEPMQYLGTATETTVVLPAQWSPADVQVTLGAFGVWRHGTNDSYLRGSSRLRFGIKLAP